MCLDVWMTGVRQGETSVFELGGGGRPSHHRLKHQQQIESVVVGSFTHCQNAGR